MNESPDNEMANIYERMIKGDKNAINNIEKLKNSPVRVSTKIQNQPATQVSESQRISQDLNKASKSQNFRKYLRQKVAQLGSANPLPKKQLPVKQKQSQKKQFAESKPFPKVRKRSQIKSQQKNSQPEIIRNLQKPIIPQKTKTTSNNFQQNIQKNIIKDSHTQKDKHSTPPSSKHSFRIRGPGGSKKLLQQLIRINEEQKRLQTQILHIHKENKDHIAEICKKYKIAIVDTHNLKETDNMSQSLDNIDSPSLNTLRAKSQYINSQQSKITKLKKQINSLTKQIQHKKTEISKKQAKIQLLPLNVILKANPDIFQERQSEQEQNEVNQLPSNDKGNADPTKTYQSVMSSMRKKKWGLDRRINYESEIIRANQSKVQIQKSPQKSQHFSPAKVQIEGQDNKIVVNSRLKQFLFE